MTSVAASATVLSITRSQLPHVAGPVVATSASHAAVDSRKRSRRAMAVEKIAGELQNVGLPLAKRRHVDSTPLNR